VAMNRDATTSAMFANAGNTNTAIAGKGFDAAQFLGAAGLNATQAGLNATQATAASGFRAVSSVTASLGQPVQVTSGGVYIQGSTLTDSNAGTNNRTRANCNSSTGATGTAGNAASPSVNVTGTSGTTGSPSPNGGTQSGAPGGSTGASGSATSGC
jgi:hypothetical protein